MHSRCRCSIFANRSVGGKCSRDYPSGPLPFNAFAVTKKEFGKLLTIAPFTLHDLRRTYRNPARPQPRGGGFSFYLLFGTGGGLGSVITLTDGNGLYPFVPAARPGIFRHSIE